MSLSTAMLIGSLIALGLMVLGWIWLAMRGKFEGGMISEEEAGHMVAHGVTDSRGTVKTFFKGKAVGGSWGASISTYEVLQMIKAGKWNEALPWLTPIIGALLAFFFWPMWIALVSGIDAFPAFLFSGLFAVTAVRAAWPQKPE